MSLTACIPFFIISGFHLVALGFKDKRAANISKMLLMPSLAAAVVYSWLTGILPSSTGGQQSVSSVTVYILAALTGGFFGDYFLIRPITKSKFLKGVFAFFLGHCFYLLILVPRSHFWELPAWCVVILVSFYAFMTFGVYNILKKPRGLRGFAAVVYAFMLLLINFTSLSAILVNVFAADGKAVISPGLWLTLAGNLVFLVSDSILAITMFVKDFKGSHQAVMATYAAAQFLLVYGILF